MNSLQAVFTATAAVVVVAIGLVVAGVAVLVGLGWALIAAGALTGSAAVVGYRVLLNDDEAGS
ncbi:hypothetical protein [Mycolicibacterium sp. XJ775]